MHLPDPVCMLSRFSDPPLHVATQALLWPLAAALDPAAWAECPEAVRTELCGLALACVKGNIRKAAEKRPKMAASRWK